MSKTNVHTIIGTAFLALMCLGAEAQAPATDVDCSGCVNTRDIRSKAVTEGKLAPGSVGSRKIQRNAVTNAKIASGAVTNAKIGTGAVTNSKIANGAVTISKVSAQLSNSINSACPIGQVVYGFNANGQILCEVDDTGGGGGAVFYSRLHDSGSPSAFRICPFGSTVISANCWCNQVGGTRNIGVLVSCELIGNSGFGGCLFEALTFNLSLPAPLTEIDVVCASQSSTLASAAETGAPVISADIQSNSDNELETAKRSIEEQVARQLSAFQMRGQ